MIRQQRTWKQILVFYGLLALIPSVLAKEPPKADLALKDLEGKKVHLHDLRGSIIVLNFWATWCGPCRAEMPRLVETEKQFRGQGVIFLGTSLDDANTQNKVPGFLHDQQVDFPVWIGATTDDLDRLQMGPAVPATAFIDKEGHIVARVSGEIRPEELKERLDWLLQGQTGPAPNPMVVHLEPHK